MSGIERHRLHWPGRADGVAVKTFMPRFPHHLPMTLADDGRWTVDLFIPATARIEYRLEVRRGRRHESTLDPANPHAATNPFGENSVLWGSRYPRPDATTPPVRWRTSEFRVPSLALGGRRHHHLLSPVGIPDREPLPLFLLHDGSDWLEHGDLAGRLGSAIAGGRLPFMRVALLDPRRRNEEYVADPAHAEHTALEVPAHLRVRVGIGTQRIIGGASLGAVASWHAAQSHPDAFTGLVLQSGTFAFSSNTDLTPSMADPIRSFLRDAVERPAWQRMSIGQTCGRYESLIDWNRTVAAHLSASAAHHRYEERWTGHDWGAWSDTLVDALATAMTPTPPPHEGHV